MSETGSATPDAAEFSGRSTPSEMRAVVLRRQESRPARQKGVSVEAVEVPPVGTREVLVAVMASSINYNSVWAARGLPVSTFDLIDRFSRDYPGAGKHQQDFHVLGTDASGVVVEIGEGVTRVVPGEHVVISSIVTNQADPRSAEDGMLAEQYAWGYETNFGGLAEFTVVQENQLLPKAPHLTWEEAAVNQACLSTSYRMLVGKNGAQMKQGDIVLVWGAAGGLGSYAVQLIKNGGGIAVGVVSTAQKAEVAYGMGYDFVINRSEQRRGCHFEEGPKYWAAMKREISAAFGSEPDIVFEHTGKGTFAASVFLARTGGTVVTCGSSTGYMHEFDNRYLWTRSKRIIGSHGANDLEQWEANRLVLRGAISSAVSEIYPLERAHEALDLVESGMSVGKVGVLCLAREPGLGVTDDALRAKIVRRRPISLLR